MAACNDVVFRRFFLQFCLTLAVNGLVLKADRLQNRQQNSLLGVWTSILTRGNDGTYAPTANNAVGHRLMGGNLSRSATTAVTFQPIDQATSALPSGTNDASEKDVTTYLSKLALPSPLAL